MYVDFKIGTSSLEQYSFMEMTDIEYSIFKDLFFRHMKSLVNITPEYSEPVIDITKEFQKAEREIKYYENLLASKEL